ncbi:hypothetical protein [Citrobacter freundii]|uniref:hypothetical protein n=1 Tax=Citrobacter freundii TaxID=546 RepID=UPI001F4E36B9|nr:hypothetical protein [Citrobacter freundii]EJM7592367.1 hypothetical protein [Citrobacter freundii]EKV1387904.1 hypothetical protein [Citrobacter freundii]EKW0740703.1 hypothetical protein [Citrobacter freundii]ELP5236383.1 hypothetical protein [Citrobacter freundii]MCH9318076.1 hypothetical protein [Citrobacter freundii]
MVINNAMSNDKTKEVFLSKRIGYLLSLISKGGVFDYIEKNSFFDAISIEPVVKGDEVKGKLIYEGNGLAVLERKNALAPWSKSSLMVRNYGFHDGENYFEKSFFDNLNLQLIERKEGQFKFDVSLYSQGFSKDFCKYYFVWGGDHQVHVSLTTEVALCKQEGLYPVKIRTITIEKNE